MATKLVAHLTGTLNDSAPRLLVFLVVGTAASLLHFTIVSLLVPSGATPLTANAVGFCTAFAVSFYGHDVWSFPAIGTRDRKRTMRRFAVTASLGFAVNELLYGLLLRFTGLPYRPALVLVLAVVAAVTWILNSCWAFANDRS